jgi:hypothetical protein
VALKGLTSESFRDLGTVRESIFHFLNLLSWTGLVCCVMFGMKSMLHVIIEASGGLLEVAGRRRAHRMAVFLSVCGNRW